MKRSICAVAQFLFGFGTVQPMWGLSYVLMKVGA